MGKHQIRTFVPPSRVKPKEQSDSDDPIRKWLTVLVWVVIGCVAINLLLWLLSRGF